MRGRTIYVPLPAPAADRLRELARREFREPKDQAAYLIIAGLKAAGLDPEAADQSTVPRGGVR
jgi:hypothetical protein